MYLLKCVDASLDFIATSLLHKGKLCQASDVITMEKYQLRGLWKIFLYNIGCVESLLQMLLLQGTVITSRNGMSLFHICRIYYMHNWSRFSQMFHIFSVSLLQTVFIV